MIKSVHDYQIDDVFRKDAQKLKNASIARAMASKKAGVRPTPMNIERDAVSVLE